MFRIVYLFGVFRGWMMPFFYLRRYMALSPFFETIATDLTDLGVAKAALVEAETKLAAATTDKATKLAANTDASSKFKSDLATFVSEANKAHDAIQIPPTA